MVTLAYIAVAVFSIVVLYLSAFVTYHIVRSDSYDQKQKFWIVLLSWLVPVIWPTICIRFLSDDASLQKKPGVPLLEFIFLSGILASSSQPSNDEHIQDIPVDISSGADGSDT